jgi:hypothetical protein
MGKLIVVFIMLFTLITLKSTAQVNLKKAPDSVEKNISLKLLPQNFYTKCIGYFCKKEIQLQKITTLPIFIRLGSKEYVDYLERKPNAVKRF